MKPVLSVQGLQQNYGGFQALKGIDFELNAGECVALIGPTGAGNPAVQGFYVGEQEQEKNALCFSLHSPSLCALSHYPRLDSLLSRTPAGTPSSPPPSRRWLEQLWAL